MKYQVKFTGQFKKDVKLAKKQNKNNEWYSIFWFYAILILITLVL